MSTIAVFHADPTPENAVALAIADHRAGPLTDWPFVEALQKAEAKLRAYRKVVDALKKSGHAKPLLHELGELP